MWRHGVQVRKLSKEYEIWGMKINQEKTFYMGCGAETKDLILEDQRVCIRDVKNLSIWG